MATRWITTDSEDPKLPSSVIDASTGTTVGTLASGQAVATAQATAENAASTAEQAAPRGSEMDRLLSPPPYRTAGTGSTVTDQSLQVGEFKDGENGTWAARVSLPDSWSSYGIAMLGYNPSSADGAISLGISQREEAVGDAITGISQVFKQPTVEGEDIIQRIEVVTGRAHTPGSIAIVQVQRRGAIDAATTDTLAGSWHVIGYEFVLETPVYPSDIAVSDGPRIAGVGDSITDLTDNFIKYAANGSPAIYAGEAAVGGDTTAEMLSWFPNVEAFTPDIVHILGGTNDSRLSVTLPEFQANIKALVNKCRQVGCRPILGTVIPNDGSTGGQTRKDFIDSYNVWLAEYATDEGIVLVDYYAVLDDGTGNIATEYDADGTHPNDAGQQAMGAALAVELTAILS